MSLTPAPFRAQQNLSSLGSNEPFIAISGGSSIRVYAAIIHEIDNLKNIDREAKSTNEKSVVESMAKISAMLPCLYSGANSLRAWRRRAAAA